MKKVFVIISWLMVFSVGLALTGCQSRSAISSETPLPSAIKVLAAESFLADIAQNVAGDRLKVDTLMPLGMDPHAFEPVPQDIVKISKSDILIINGAGFEAWLQNIIGNAGGKHVVVEASRGLQSRVAREGEAAVQGPNDPVEIQTNQAGDPHFWLDPISVIKYVENIRDAFIQADPSGEQAYTSNADSYILKLKELDRSIQDQVSVIPIERRLMVTNHESFGYFADRYNFKIIGTIIPSVSSNASPSAQQLAHLIDHIKSTKAIAIFLETGTNPQLADQISKETGVKVVSDLFTHSITAVDGPAPTYIDMMKHNASSIVNALK
jgi:ABC-type Zn uptake system ZnuABC Zn-binding protein ZnuA